MEIARNPGARRQVGCPVAHEADQGDQSLADPNSMPTDVQAYSSEMLVALQGVLRRSGQFDSSALIDAELRARFTATQLPPNDGKDGRIRREGLAIYLSHEVFEDLAHKPPRRRSESAMISLSHGERLPSAAEVVITENPSGVSLWSALYNVSLEADRLVHRNLGAYGVTKQDLEGVNDNFSFFWPNLYGLNVPLYYASGVANAIIALYVESGFLDQQQRQEMTLTDWATIIEQPWFSKIMHSLSYTGESVMATFGENIKDYASSSFDDRMASTVPGWQGAALQCVSANRQPPAVRLNPDLERRLRSLRRPEHRCPGALLGLTIPDEVLQQDYHLQHMQAGNVLSRAGGDRYQLKQTEIDLTLTTYAAWLRAYDRAYGTPRHDGAIEYDLKSHGPGYIMPLRLEHRRDPQVLSVAKNAENTRRQ